MLRISEREWVRKAGDNYVKNEKKNLKHHNT